MTAPPTPTPNAMPGAQQPNTNPQLQEPISTSPPPAAPPAQQPDQNTPVFQPPEQHGQPPETKPSETEGPGPDTVEYWQRRSREWEDKAKVKGDVLDKAKKWDDAEASRRTKEENQAIEIARAQEDARQAREEAARERVARETGVLPQLLGGGTEEEMRASAQVALDWRGPQSSEPPRPQTAAVSASTVTSADKLGHAPNGVQQLTKEQFVALPPAERMTAVRNGQCVDLGIGKPAYQRRMGNQVDLGAHMSGGKQ